MDTKQLFDIALESGLDFRGDSFCVEDFIPVWVEAHMADEEWIAENWMDAVSEGIYTLSSESDTRKERARQRNEMLTRYIVKAGDAFSNIDDSGMSSTDGLRSCHAVSYTTQCSNIGEQIQLLVREYATHIVEKYAEEWCNDCAGYQHEMDQCAYEDYYDGVREERLLDRD